MVVNREELIASMRKHAVEPANGEPPRYVRLRCGRARKSADTVVRSELVGLDPTGVVDLLLERWNNQDEKGWIEVLERGGRSTVDCIAIGTPPKDGDDDPGEGFETIDIDGGKDVIMGHLVSAIVQTNAQLATRLSSTEGRYHELMMRHVETAGRATAAETLLTWIEEHGVPGQGDDEYTKALELLAPSLGPALTAVVTSLAANKGGGANDNRAETADTKADRVIREIEEVWRDAPDSLLRQDRLMRLGAIASSIQDRVKGAMG